MIVFRRILLPTDFSGPAANAARIARALAERYRATLYVLHIGQPVWCMSPTPAMSAEIVALPPDESRLRAKLEGFVRRTLTGIRTPVVTELRSGSPARAIANYAREIAVDLIVLGTRTRHVVSRLRVGSVNRAVLEDVGCPVLMIPLTKAPEAWSPDPGEFVARGRLSGAI